MKRTYPHPIISRKFGLRPFELDVKLSPDVFSRFEKVVNAMIRGGIKLNDDHFRYEGLTAVKIFYDQVRKDKSVSKIMRNTGFKERVWRCAAQPAYFAIREYKRRGKIISLLAGILFSSDGVLEHVSIEEFPTAFLLQKARNAVNATMSRGLYASNEFLGNMYRHVRNLLRKELKDTFSEDISKILEDIMSSTEVVPETAAWISRKMHERLKAFFKKLSWIMTNRVNRIITNKGMPSEKGRVEALISQIIGGDPLNKREWKRNRERWRKEQGEELEYQIDQIDAKDIAKKAFDMARSRLTTARAVNLAFKLRIKSARVNGETLADFKEFLTAESVREIEIIIVNKLRSLIEIRVRNLLGALSNLPWRLLKKPHFQSQSIPFGIDDDQIYKLELLQATKEVRVTLSFYPREQLQFKIKGPKRFYTMIDKGFQPKQGILIKKSGGGLILAVPFERELELKVEKGKFVPAATYYRVAGLDLGLKTFGVISIDECVLGLSGCWKKVDETRGDLARYFLDQRQLVGKRDEWILAGSERIFNFFNAKRRLTALQDLARTYQSRMKRYASKYSDNYRRKKKFWRLRREWKRVWRKIENLHGELANQIATRVLAVLQHQHVDLLRLEDLSWAKHSPKNKVGYFLTTWQVHWFHARIKELIAPMAERAGIHVESVDPRDTSNRCSRCGEIGSRKGKRFQCPHCGFELDADLNAARNIIVAPNSPTAICGQGRVSVTTQS